MSESEPRKSNGCDSLQGNLNMTVIISLIVVGALAIMFALSMLFTAGAYNNFVWNFATYPTWQFIIAIAIGIFAIIAAIWLWMKKSDCK